MNAVEKACATTTKAHYTEKEPHTVTLKLVWYRTSGWGVIPGRMIVNLQLPPRWSSDLGFDPQIFPERTQSTWPLVATKKPWFSLIQQSCRTFCNFITSTCSLWHRLPNYASRLCSLCRCRMKSELHTVSQSTGNWLFWLCWSNLVRWSPFNYRPIWELTA